MATNELKKFVIESGLYQRYAKARHNSYLEEVGEPFNGETLRQFECEISSREDWFQIVEECERIGSTSRQRIKRLKERVRALLTKGECLFLTLTFNDLTMTENDKKQRRALVSNYLKSLNCDYIANIDYGKINEREHYHAVVCVGQVDYSKWHQNGAIFGEKVRLKGGSGANIARYIDKLSLHALKDTTYRNRLLYSRCVL